MWKIHEGLNTFDETVRQALQSVCNINMDNSTWTQATLPTSKGGLGVRRASDLALPAFLASCYGTHDLVSSLLPPVELGNDPLLREALNLWEANTTCPLPPEEMRGRQRRWDELLTQKTHEDLLEAATDSITRARLLSTATKESGAWLNVLPIPHLGTKLDDDSPQASALGLTLLWNTPVSAGLRWTGRECMVLVAVRVGAEYLVIMLLTRLYVEHLCRVVYLPFWNLLVYVGKMRNVQTA